MLNSPQNRALVISEFPLLAQDPDFKVEDDDVPDYNCIAWAGNRTDVWWQHLPLDGRPFKFDGVTYDWPFGVADNAHLTTLIEIFTNLNYESCANGNFEKGFQKICFYGHDENEITHAAKQFPIGKYQGKWTSKLGKWFRINHGTPYTIEQNPIYGSVIHFMRRPWP
jgi:hypothetical protein